jgi:hypothetical protein
MLSYNLPLRQPLHFGFGYGAAGAAAAAASAATLPSSASVRGLPLSGEGVGDFLRDDSDTEASVGASTAPRSAARAPRDFRPDMATTSSSNTSDSTTPDGSPVSVAAPTLKYEDARGSATPTATRSLSYDHESSSSSSSGSKRSRDGSLKRDNGRYDHADVLLPGFLHGSASGALAAAAAAAAEMMEESDEQQAGDAQMSSPGSASSNCRSLSGVRLLRHRLTDNLRRIRQNQHICTTRTSRRTLSRTPRHPPLPLTSPSL